MTIVEDFCFIAMQHIKNIIIVGGGTAGWMTAAGLSKVLSRQWNIQLIESEEIGVVGVGEATIPLINIFNEALEINQDEFIRETNGTFKLGIEFVNWGKLGDSYIHGFGPLGPDIGITKFHQFWLKQRLKDPSLNLEDFSINTAAARKFKFLRAQTDMQNSPLGEITHAYHFDAILYARYLRKYAEARGVKRIEGKITGATRHGETGFIEAVHLENGASVSGDLFVDCSGFQGLLIEKELQAGYEDWSHWLPCNRAWAVPCESTAPLLPYTRSTAHTAGWQWRIPLQHRIGNGHVYSNDFMPDDQAVEILMKNLDGKALADPRQLKFVTGKRKKLWVKNCVAVGLASGFMEPLESTSIHLIQSTISRLVAFFPHEDFSQADIDEFNRQSDFEFEKIRDFLILHYKATNRDDSEFWKYCKNLRTPDSLQNKIDLFRNNGRVFRDGIEMFTEISWVEVMIGQGIVPKNYHPLVDTIEEAEIERYLAKIQTTIAKCVDVMPLHADYVKEHCNAMM
jgi:tryptophan halogenase